MKLFVCLWGLFAVANAGFLGLGGGGSFGHGHKGAPQYNHGQAQIFKVKVIKEGHGGSYNPGFSQSQHHSHSPAPQIIKVIHQQAESTAASSIGATLGPVSAPAKVIKLIHEHIPRHVGSHSTSASSIQPHFSAPAKVIRIIHELAPSQPAPVPAASFPTAAVSDPGYNYLPPVEAPAQNFNQYSPPSPQYLPPVPQYGAPQPSFTAPEPVPAPAHIPAQSYGPPSQ